MNEDEEYFQFEHAEEVEHEKFELEDRCANGYQVVIRFRNKEDYFQFADLIEQPKLKVYSKVNMRETSWPIKEPENSLFD